jgi:hypothetical protein
MRNQLCGVRNQLKRKLDRHVFGIISGKDTERKTGVSRTYRNTAAQTHSITESQKQKHGSTESQKQKHGSTEAQKQKHGSTEAQKQKHGSTEAQKQKHGSTEAHIHTHTHTRTHDVGGMHKQLMPTRACHHPLLHQAGQLVIEFALRCNEFLELLLPLAQVRGAVIQSL